MKMFASICEYLRYVSYRNFSFIVQIRQYVPFTVDSCWLQCGHFLLNDICLNIVIPVDDSTLPNRRREFIERHDRRTHRLYFVWQRANDVACGCAGGCRFIDDIDTSGMMAFDKRCRQLCIDDRQSTFGQSILRPTERYELSLSLYRFTFQLTDIDTNRR